MHKDFRGRLFPNQVLIGYSYQVFNTKHKQVMHAIVELYKTAEMEVYLLDDLILSRWLPASTDMTEEVYQKHLSTVIKLFWEQVNQQKLQFSYVLDDSRQMYFSISPELQQWAARELVAFYKEVRLKKYALIMPQSFIESLAFEQTIEEAAKLRAIAGYTSKSFADPAEGLEWLGKPPLTLPWEY